MFSEECTLSSDGLRLAAQVTRPPQTGAAPGLILCHGFGGCKERLALFADQAAARGWMALSFDFRGHGASDGCLDSHTVNDVRAAFDWLSAHPAVDARQIG